VQNYETIPTGITSIEGLQLEIKFKQCSCSAEITDSDVLNTLCIISSIHTV
jgi:hypothetical protein